MDYGHTVKRSGFNQTHIFPFERDFNEEVFFQWISQNWTLSMWCSAVYVIIIIGGRYYMQKRPPYEIRAALAMWSTLLSIFSIVGAFRTIPEAYFVLNEHGWEYSVCITSYTIGPTAFWTFLFTVSKVFELGDTIFIILRKQPLIFLHWYHHVTVLIYTWFSYTEHLGPGRWFIVMNYTVHSIMYTYYAMKAMKIRLPKFISMVITAMQILQMVIGIVVNYNAYLVKRRGDFCQTTYSNLKLSSSMYGSYFVLFAYFFYKAYFMRKAAAKRHPEYTSIKKIE